MEVTFLEIQERSISESWAGNFLEILSILPTLAPSIRENCSQRHSKIFPLQVDTGRRICDRGNLGKVRILIPLLFLSNLTLSQHPFQTWGTQISMMLKVHALSLSGEQCHSEVSSPHIRNPGFLLASHLCLPCFVFASQVLFLTSAIFDLLEDHGICHKFALVQKSSLLRTQSIFPVRILRSITASPCSNLLLFTGSAFNHPWFKRKQCMSLLTIVYMHVHTHIGKYFTSYL